MARIPLRAYLREIDHLIDSASIDAAIAHCRYILRTYPKDVATYRLLGKAYLEMKRYADAADILQRVLSVVPDDFVSHIGMSIIREDEGNLDAAIWHMERAFDSQPSNQTIQDELKRLYGRRDGVQPPKIHLTRGALARMYAKGNLYQQAITELRAALAEDPQRPDLHVLLARMYLQTGQRLESAETCSTLLNKLPYCLEANQILAEILPGTERAADAQAYFRRIQALDPYAAFTTPQTPTPDKVPEASITIDRYDGSIGEQIPSITEQPSWATSLGVDLSELTPVGKGLPDWLSPPQGETPPFEREGLSVKPTTDVSKDMSPDEPEHELEPEIKMEGAEEMVSEEDIGEEDIGEEGKSPLPPEVDGESPEELEPVEIPEWLRSIAPPEAGLEGEPSLYEPEFYKDQALEGGEEIPEWLRDIGKGPTIDDKSRVPGEPSESEPEKPTWLQDMETGVSEEEQKPLAQEEEPQEEPSPFEADQEQLTEWLSTETSGAVESPEIPDWLKDFSEEPQEESQPKSIEGVEESTEIPGFEELRQPPEEEQIPEWMEEETDQSGEEFEIPEWLQSISDESTSAEKPQEPEIVEPSEEEAAEPSEIETPSIPSPGLEDQESALAWMEGLAAKQGAPEEELISSPEDRPEKTPEWLLKYTQETSEKVLPKEPSYSLETETEEEKIPEELVAQSSEEPEPEGEVESLPEWLRAMEDEAPIEGIQGQAEGMALEPELESEGVSPEASEEFEIPDWLSGIGEEEEVEELEFADLTAEADQELTSEDAMSPEPKPTAEFEAQTEETEMILGDTQPVQVSPEITEEEVSQVEGEKVLEESFEAEGTTPGKEPEVPAEEIPYEEEVEPKLSVIPEPTWESAEIPDWISEESIEAISQEPTIEPTVEAEEIEELEQVPEWLQEFEGIPEESPPAFISEELEVPSEEGVEGEQVIEAEVQPEEPLEEPPSMVPESLEAPPEEIIEVAEIIETEVQPEEPLEEPPSMVPESLEAPPEEIIEAAEIVETEVQPEEFLEEPPSMVPESLEAPPEEIIEVAEIVETEVQPEEPLEEAPSMVPEGLEAPPEEIIEVEKLTEDKIQLEVELEEEATSLEATPEPVSRIPINSASFTQLEQIPGVGSVTAESIVTYRQTHGPFTSLEQLQKVPGIGPVILENLLPWLELDLVEDVEAISQEIELKRLADARNALEKDELPEALDHYASLIQEGKLIGEIIPDLEELSLQKPRNLAIFQLLGDAYMRGDRLQEALDAYTKAEELL